MADGSRKRRAITIPQVDHARPNNFAWNEFGTVRRSVRGHIRRQVQGFASRSLAMAIQECRDCSMQDRAGQLFLYWPFAFRNLEVLIHAGTGECFYRPTRPPYVDGVDHGLCSEAEVEAGVAAGVIA